MKIKPGANYDDLTDDMKRACEIAEEVYAEQDYILVLTSGRDGVHGLTTLHGDGEAGDFRTRQILPEKRKPIADEIRRRLNKEKHSYDVILEENHLHIEHDPKGESA